MFFDNLDKLFDITHKDFEIIINNICTVEDKVFLLNQRERRSPSVDNGWN